jgi:hypothetical protein
MILYNSRAYGGLLVLTSCKGSPFFASTLVSLPLALLSGGFALSIKLLPVSGMHLGAGHPHHHCPL